jgi:hypothetical protein
VRKAGQLKKKKAATAPRWKMPKAVTETQLIPVLLMMGSATDADWIVVNSTSFTI